VAGSYRSDLIICPPSNVSPASSSAILPRNRLLRILCVGSDIAMVPAQSYRKERKGGCHILICLYPSSGPKSLIPFAFRSMDSTQLRRPGYPYYLEPGLPVFKDGDCILRFQGFVDAVGFGGDRNCGRRFVMLGGVLGFVDISRILKA
jgi:hypothetical protein